MPSAVDRPDPLLTANVYCAGRLDWLIHRAVAPFWNEFQSNDDPERTCSLWLVRYGKGGEHLKIRLHGPENQRVRLHARLGEAVGRFFAALDSVPAEPRPPWTATLPPIDREDETATVHPDRTLLWTTYRRSHISLGGHPFLADDRSVARLTRCLAQACERVLPLPLEDGERYSRTTCQTSLIDALASATAALDWSTEVRDQYFRYHRDWLVRSNYLHVERADLDPVQWLLERYDTQLAKMQEPLRRLSHLAWGRWAGERAETAAEAPWGRSLLALREAVSLLCRDRGAGIDPRAGDPLFAPLLKVFHGLGNQLGLSLQEEGFAYHLLLALNRDTGRGQESADADALAG